MAEEQTSFPGYGVSLAEKTQRAINLLKLWEESALKLSPDGYWIGFSGGKDSCVILELAKMAGVKFRAVYNVTTIDPPELTAFIKQHHPDVHWKKPKRGFFHALIESHGPPTRMIRWCCEEFKESGGDGLIKLLGVRAAESVKRAKRWKEVTLWRSNLGGFVVAPIVYWSDSEVWQFIREHKLPYCPLYDEGWKRLGCIGCPMAGDLRIAEFRRWPKFEAAWKHAFKMYFDPRKGVPNRFGKERYIERWDTWEEYWDWWMSGKPSAPDEEPCLGLYDEEEPET